MKSPHSSLIQRVMILSKELEEVYDDRNVLAVAFVKFKTIRDPVNVTMYYFIMSDFPTTIKSPRLNSRIEGKHE